MLIEYNEHHHISRNVRFLRKKYSLSRRALARLVGISEFRLERIEEGTAVPVISDAVLRRLCQVFDVDSEELLFRSIEL